MSDRIDFSDAQYIDAPPAQSELEAPPITGIESSPRLLEESSAAHASVGSALESPTVGFGSQTATPIIDARPERSRLARFGRAWTFGWLAALASAAAWGGILALTGREFGLLAIGVGVLVGRAVRFGTDDVGGRGYQLLAVFLTWMGITLGYTPTIAAGLSAEAPYPIAFVFSLFLAPFTPWLSLAEEAGQGLLGLVIIGVGLFEAFRVNTPHPSSARP